MIAMIAATAKLFLLSDHSDRSDHMETGLYGNHFPAIAGLFFAAIEEKHVVLLRKKKATTRTNKNPKKMRKAN